MEDFGTQMMSAFFITQRGLFFILPGRVGRPITLPGAPLLEQNIQFIRRKETKFMNETKKMYIPADVSLTKEEEKLIKLIRKIEFGEARVVINDGKPIRVEEIKKSIKL